MYNPCKNSNNQIWRWGENKVKIENCVILEISMRLHGSLHYGYKVSKLSCAQRNKECMICCQRTYIYVCNLIGVYMNGTKYRKCVVFATQF